MYYFMDIFYALGMNIAKKVTVKFGQTDDFNKKFCTFDEVIKLMNEAVKEPEHSGNYHDYVELCKLYDKNENGTMMLAELENILCNLGKYLSYGIQHWLESNHWSKLWSLHTWINLFGNFWPHKIGQFANFHSLMMAELKIWPFYEITEFIKIEMLQPKI